MIQINCDSQIKMQSQKPAFMKKRMPKRFDFSKSKLLLLVFAAIGLPQVSALGQVELSTAQLTVGNPTVSKVTDMTLQMFKTNRGSNWQPNQCFQLFIDSPYAEATAYSSFNGFNAPVCTSQTKGITVGSCTVYAADTLNIVLSSVDPSVADSKSVQIHITNFNTPFSSQVLRTINIRGYSDKFCQADQRTTSLPMITMQPDIMDGSKVVLSSSEDTLGVKNSANTLSVKFIPKTTMSPSGAGKIEIEIPVWYQIGNTADYMYNPIAENRCTSSCMRVTSSELVNDRILVNYDSMAKDCISGHQIQIDCRQFYNPIVPELIYGFNVLIYDNEADSKLIELTENNKVVFNAKQLKPQIIPISNFVMDLGDSMIQEYSTWTLTLNVNIPLQRGCFIQFFLPTQFTYDITEIIASGIFVGKDGNPFTDIGTLRIKNRFLDPTITKSSVIIDGCHQDASLGLNPYGRLDITSIKSQSSVRDSDEWEIHIYKDYDLTERIAVLASGAILTSDRVEPGSLDELTISPSNNVIQAVNDITIAFKTQHTLLGGAGSSVKLPPGLSIPKQGGTAATSVSVQLMDGTVVEAKILEENVLLIPNVVPASATYNAGTKISYTLKGIKNQMSAKDAGSFTVKTLDLVKGAYYLVDEQTASTSFTASTGKINPVGEITMSDPTNSAKNVEYSFKFTMDHDLPPSSYIRIQLPPEVTLTPSSVLSKGSCKVHFCSDVTKSSVDLLIKDGLLRGSVHTFVIGGALNPRSFQPTGLFKIKTVDTDAVTPIDDGFNKAATMTISGDMPNFSVVQANKTNGVTNTYTFTAQTVIPVMKGDQLKFSIPPEVGYPRTVQQMDCKPLINVNDTTCEIAGNTVTVIFNNFEFGSKPFSWSISGLRNPYSTAPSQPFDGVKFLDAVSGYEVSSPKAKLPYIQNSEPRIIQFYKLDQTNLQPGETSDYKLTFEPNSPIPATGSILIQYPMQVQLIDGDATSCIVTTTQGQQLSKCEFQTSSKSILIKDIFTSPYDQVISIELKNIRNPATNKPGNGFVIQTYSDKQQIFIQDRLPDFILVPQFECDYPCLTCVNSKDKKAMCTSCWKGGLADFQFLMFYPNGTQTCRPYCEAGYTTNGNADLLCTKCDESCATCQETYTLGDVRECLDCAATHPFRLSQTKTCLTKCAYNMFESTQNTCAYCKEPCLGCKHKERTCTSCNSISLLPKLFGETCIDVCPNGFVSMNNVCTKCNSPCAECRGHPDNCVTCDNTGGTKFVYLDRCWAECPVGSAPDTENLTCVPCKDGCDLCEIAHLDQCLKCTRPTIAYERQCYDKCPDGFSPNSPEGDGRSCRPWKLGDIGILYFPFIIFAAVMSCVFALGECKRRAKIDKKTQKMKWFRPQNTITCIIIVLAPIQFVAIIAQWIFSFFYGAHTFCICAIAVTVAYIILNFTFQSLFFKYFDSKMVPMDIERKIRLGKLDRTQARYNMVPKDDKYSTFKRSHKTTVCMTYFLTTFFAWKSNKLFYSHLFDLRMFAAPFSRAKFYRKTITSFQIAHMIVIDLFLICLDITALTQIESMNMMWVVVIETLVLSVAGIILGCIELYLLKYYLEYTEPRKASKNILDSDDSAYDDDKDLNKKFNKTSMSQRRLLMNSVIKDVKHLKHRFLNNKLDELLVDFGNRKCKSMIDLGTGWELVDDPRLANTWPVSPGLQQDYEDAGIQQFTEADAYGAQGNNVYAEAKSKFMNNDFATQDDAGFLEFQDALNRKHGGLLSQNESYLDEIRMKRKKRRRGRKNKYYAQIDQEDDQEVEPAEASEDETLKVIKEQQEEEENFRKTIQAETQKHLESTQERKKLIEANASEIQARMAQEAEISRTKQQERERQVQEAHQAEIEMKKRQAEQSKRLQDQYREEIRQKEIDAKKRADELALHSKQNRDFYERQEKERIDKEKVLALQKEEDDLLRQAEKLAAEKTAREQEIRRQQDLQQRRDVSDFQSNQERQKAFEEQRLAEKQQLKMGGALALTSQQERVLVGQSNNDAVSNTMALHAPARAELRTFNENDIYGELDRDKSGFVVVPTSGQDKNGKAVNKRGYCINQHTGAIVDKTDAQVMFPGTTIDPTGEIPAPFCLERYNFNPHHILGDFKFVDGQPELHQSEQGFFVDRRGRRVTKHGWLTQGSSGCIIDSSGRKKFDKEQLTQDQNLKKLFNFQGNPFDVRDVMGIFDKDDQGQIILTPSQKGGYQDLLERRVNSKGYLTDAAGNIINIQKQVVWEKCELKNGEFPKIFPFTKFNILKIRGDIGSNSAISKNAQGHTVDRLNRLVNKKGYLVDLQGNVVDVYGNRMFDKAVLANDGNIPPVFRTEPALLTAHSTRSLEVLKAQISMINDQIRQDNQQEADDHPEHHFQGDTSLDSQMEDTPANYDYGNTAGAQRRKPKKGKVVEILPPTERELKMASAYGGAAVGTVRRPGVKYENERLQSKQTVRINSGDGGQQRSDARKVIQSVSVTHKNQFATMDQEPHNVKHQGLMMSPDIPPIDASRHPLSPGTQREADTSAIMAEDNKRGKRPGVKDFEEMFGQELDDFLEDSQWEDSKDGDVKQARPKKQNK